MDSNGVVEFSSHRTHLMHEFALNNDQNNIFINDHENISVLHDKPLGLQVVCLLRFHVVVVVLVFNATLTATFSCKTKTVFIILRLVMFVKLLLLFFFSRSYRLEEARHNESFFN